MNPPFAYYGGKTGLAPRIVNLMPDHRVYIEPFLGSGAVLFAKRQVQHEIVNDVDGGVVAFFTALRDTPEDLERVCRLTPYARAEFNACRDQPDDLPTLERARRFWVRVNQSFAKTAGTQAGWSVTTARSQSTAESVRGRIARFREVAERFHRVCIESCDGVDLLARLATPDTVTYVDPPYEASTRRSRRAGSACADYRHDMGDPESHERLADELHRTPATVFLSGYHSPLYDRLYGDWDRVEWVTHAHSSNAVNVSRNPRIEVLWSNRPIARPNVLALDWTAP